LKRSEDIQAVVLEMLGVTHAESENVSHSQLRWLSSEKRYEGEVAALSSLAPEQAQAEARKIMRRLAYSFWHQAYGPRDMNERFESLWQMAFPEEEKGDKK
jgi:hypothetical protein